MKTHTANVSHTTVAVTSQSVLARSKPWMRADAGTLLTTTAGSNLALQGAGNIGVTQAISGGKDVSLNITKGDISFSSTVLAAEDIGLSTPGNITQLSKGAGLTAGGLLITGGATAVLLGAGNDVVTIAANPVARVAYADSNGFSVGTVTVDYLTAGTFAAKTASGIASLGQAYLAGKGNISIDQAVTAAGDVVVDATAGSITVKAAVTVTGKNDIGLMTSGAITQTAAGVLSANGLLVGGGAANTLAAPAVDLSTAANAISVVGAKASTLSLKTAGAVDVGSVTASNADAGVSVTIGGINTTGAVALNAGGDITQTQAINAPSLAVTSTGKVLLDTQGNNVNTLTGTAASIAFKDVDGIALGNITTTGKGGISVTAGASVTQTGALATTGGGNLSVVATTGNVTLPGANSIDGLVNIQARAGDIVYNEVGNLMIGYAAGQKVTFIATGDITDNQNGIGEAIVDATTSITLNAGGIILTDVSPRPFTGFNTPLLTVQADGVQANGKSIDVYGAVTNQTLIFSKFPKGSAWLNGLQIFPPINNGAITAALQSDLLSTGEISMMPPLSIADLYSTDDFSSASLREMLENAPAPTVGLDAADVHINNGGIKLPAGVPLTPGLASMMLVPGGAPMNLPNGTLVVMEANGDVVITLPTAPAPDVQGGATGTPTLSAAGGLSAVIITPAGIIVGRDANGLSVGLDGGIAGNAALRGLLDQIADFLPDEYKRRWGVGNRTAGTGAGTKISKL